MIDKLKLSIFLKPEFLIVCESGQMTLNYPLLQLWGFKVSAGSVDYDEIYNDFNGEYELKVTSIDNPQHPWDSLKSSYSGLAIKWQNSNSLMSEPRLEIKASPAKLSQGHNVFGSTSIRECSKYMLNVLFDKFDVLLDKIDITRTTLDLIDVTYSVPVEPRHHKMLISTMKNISSGQMRKSATSDEITTTCYWGLGSKRKTLKCYLKNDEMNQDLQKLIKSNSKNPYDELTLSRLKIMSDKKLQEFAKPLMRFEATLKKDFFRSTTFFGDDKKPYTLRQWADYQDLIESRGECLILNLWKFSFNRLLTSLSGKAIDMQDENLVLEKLKKSYFKETKKGLTYAKAYRVFDFYKNILKSGYSETYENYKENRATFGRYKKDIIKATGISDAALQNLRFDNKELSVQPFYKLVQFDFSKQFPSWINDHVIGSEFNHNELMKKPEKNVLNEKQTQIIKKSFAAYVNSGEFDRALL